MGVYSKIMKTKNFENKYRKAFNRLITFALSTEMGIRDYGDYYMSDWESDSDVVKELIDKQEPMKVIGNRCQTCDGHITNRQHLDKIDYCNHCGQK